MKELFKRPLMGDYSLGFFGNCYILWGPCMFVLWRRNEKKEKRCTFDDAKHRRHWGISQRTGHSGSSRLLLAFGCLFLWSLLTNELRIHLNLFVKLLNNGSCLWRSQNKFYSFFLFFFFSIRCSVWVLQWFVSWLEGQVQTTSAAAISM